MNYKQLHTAVREYTLNVTHTDRPSGVCGHRFGSNKTLKYAMNSKVVTRKWVRKFLSAKPHWEEIEDAILIDIFSNKWNGARTRRQSRCSICRNQYRFVEQIMQFFKRRDYSSYGCCVGVHCTETIYKSELRCSTWCQRTKRMEEKGTMKREKKWRNKNVRATDYMRV